MSLSSSSTPLNVTLLEDPQTQISDLKKNMNQLKKTVNQMKFQTSATLNNHKRFIEQNINSTSRLNHQQSRFKKTREVLLDSTILSVGLSCLSLIVSLFTLSSRRNRN